ncbi:hypothetical protein WHZ78_01305 [Bradyrhizobium symbiodeficiens]|uniref:hypothetical protein n=1 Tax=Bradyrhizobium symbiodeficiens TaxID=1404367 RepID=UPI0030D08FCA
MANVVPLFALREIPIAVQPSPALQRLEGIRDVLSTLDLSEMQGPQEIERALWTLDTANKCIRMVLADLQGGPCTEQLVRQSEELVAAIGVAREKIAAFATSFY